MTGYVPDCIAPELDKHIERLESLEAFLADRFPDLTIQVGLGAKATEEREEAIRLFREVAAAGPSILQPHATNETFVDVRPDRGPASYVVVAKGDTVDLEAIRLAALEHDPEYMGHFMHFQGGLSLMAARYASLQTLRDHQSEN